MSAHAYKAIAERSRTYNIQKMLNSNQHTLIQMNSSEFLDYVFSVKKAAGFSKDKTVEWITNILKDKNIRSEYWEQHKVSIKIVTGLIPLGMDYYALGAIALEMQRGGNVFSKYKFATYNGKVNIIFEGYSGLRNHLTGTRYLANNPKVISFGIGKSGVVNSLKKGFILTIIISATFHCVEQLLNDQATWHNFIGGLAVDMAITVASSGIAWATIAFSVGGTAAMVAVGPIIAVVIVGSILGAAIYAFVDSDSISNQLANSLRQAEERFINNTQQMQREIVKAQQWYNQDPIGFMMKLFGGSEYSGIYK